MKADTTTEQLKKEFQFTLSRLSHEIRNPIALISSELQMVADSHPELADSDGWEDIMDNLDYVTELLNELSSYNNANRISLSDTDMKSYLDNIISTVKPTLKYLGIALETYLPLGLPVLPIDRLKLRQALLNLLRNAQESISRPDGKILFRARPYRDGICICIQDNGCGMSGEQLEKIFTPFVTFKPAGTGLGPGCHKADHRST